MGSPALTSRGFVEKDFVKVAEFVDRAINLTIDIKKSVGGKLKDFREAINKEVSLKSLVQSCYTLTCCTNATISVILVMLIRLLPDIFDLANVYFPSFKNIFVRSLTVLRQFCPFR